MSATSGHSKKRRPIGNRTSSVGRDVASPGRIHPSPGSKEWSIAADKQAEDNFEHYATPDLTYRPTSTIDPSRPRTLAAGYDRGSKTVTVEFRSGAQYNYYDVPANVWANFRRVKSPGRFINRVLNSFDYEQIKDAD